MILIVDVCCEKNSLSFDEFVKPVVTIAEKEGKVSVAHFSEVSAEEVRKADKIIICGTALKDNEFMNHIEKFGWLKDIEKPVLGICAGMQTIARIFGGNIERRTEIGMEEIKIIRKGTFLGDKDFKAYELHNFAAALPNDFELIAKSGTCIQAFAHKSRPMYGVMFHPEVRNMRILEEFMEMQ
jgi:GMP synthase-like glutamine amidotransferase